jgi:hypothetical protein
MTTWAKSSIGLGFVDGGWNVFVSSTRNGETQDVRTWAVDQLSIATPEQRAAVKRIEP